MVNPMKDCMAVCGSTAMLAACAVAEDYIRLTADDTGDNSSFAQLAR